MSVSSAVTIKQRPWRGYDDPGLPVGMYVAAQTILGDAGGGDESILFVFRNEANPVTGRFYNIEQIEIMRTGSGATAGSIETINFEAVSPTGLINFERAVRVETDNSIFGFAYDIRSGPRMPLFLGSAQAVRDLEAQVIVRFPNALNVTLAASIQGYIWEARSVMAEGGLRRPLDSLYGR